MRELIVPDYHGFTTQVVWAVNSLTPAEWEAFQHSFPEWQRVIEIIAAASPLSNYYPEDGDPDVEIINWAADWIEQNTSMCWEDGDLFYDTEPENDE